MPHLGSPGDILAETISSILNSKGLPSTESGREELPQFQSQEQKPGGPHARGAVAKRSYPTSEVRGNGQEWQAATAQVTAERSYPTSEVRGGRGRNDAEAGTPVLWPPHAKS